jgi:hypothetical protein
MRAQVSPVATHGHLPMTIELHTLAQKSGQYESALKKMAKKSSITDFTWLFIYKYTRKQYKSVL